MNSRPGPSSCQRHWPFNASAKGCLLIRAAPDAVRVPSLHVSGHRHYPNCGSPTGLLDRGRYLTTLSFSSQVFFFLSLQWVHSNIIMREIWGNPVWRFSEVVSNEKGMTCPICLDSGKQPCIKSIFYYRQLPLTLESLLSITGFSVAFQWLMFKATLDFSTTLTFGF